MSTNQIDGVGFISRSAFVEACRAMEHLGLEHCQPTLTISARGEVGEFYLGCPLFECFGWLIRSSGLMITHVQFVEVLILES